MSWGLPERCPGRPASAERAGGDPTTGLSCLYLQGPHQSGAGQCSPTQNSCPILNHVHLLGELPLRMAHRISQSHSICSLFTSSPPALKDHSSTAWSEAALTLPSVPASLPPAPDLWLLAACFCHDSPTGPGPAPPLFSQLNPDLRPCSAATSSSVLLKARASVFLVSQLLEQRLVPQTYHLPGTVSFEQF